MTVVAVRAFSTTNKYHSYSFLTQYGTSDYNSTGLHQLLVHKLLHQLISNFFNFS